MSVFTHRPRKRQTQREAKEKKSKTNPCECADMLLLNTSNIHANTNRLVRWGCRRMQACTNLL